MLHMSMYVRGRGQEGHGMEGVTGLKSLGVRDLTYRLAFLATTVTPTDLQVDWLTRLLSPLLISLSPRPLLLPPCLSLPHSLVLARSGAMM